MFKGKNLTKQKLMVFTAMDDIMSEWLAGGSLRVIVDRMFGGELLYSEFYQIMYNDILLNAKYKKARELKSHSMIDTAAASADAAMEYGILTKDTSALRTGMTGALKVAAKLNPEEYSDRIELTGAKGTPVSIEADLTISPADAYDKLINGG